MSAFQPSSVMNGVPRFSHITGDVFFRRRATQTLASMMGFILNKNRGSYMKNLKPHELKALHERRS